MENIPDLLIHNLRNMRKNKKMRENGHEKMVIHIDGGPDADYDCRLLAIRTGVG